MHVLEALEARGFIKQCSNLDGLRAALDQGPLTFYVGFDPTADSLHVGHLLPMVLMAHLQRAGHRAVALVGGGTGLVGDPSGKTEARQLLTEDQVRANVVAITEQIGRVVDLSHPSRGLVADNAEWLTPLRYLEFLRDVGSCFSVNRMIKAEGYRQRLERESGLSFLEFNYQLLQAYDFLVLHQRHGCRLQVGGDDQWGNILAGVDLVRRKAQAEVFGLTLPLLTTATGQKMGKTHTGAVWLSAARFPPFDFYQYWLNVDDRDVGRLLRVFTFVPLDEIQALEALQGADVRRAKQRLAWEVTALIHGEEAADQARAGAEAMVAGQAAEDLPTLALSAERLDQGVPLFAVLREAGLARSGGEARRLVQQGGVRVGAAEATDPEAPITAAQVGSEGLVVRVGKKRAARVVSG